MELLHLATSKNIYKEWILENYSEIWEKTISDFQSGGIEASVYLLDASSYLFNTGGVKWAVDPVYCAYFVSAPKNAAEDLLDLDLILLSHAHLDHFDTTLLKGLCQNESLILAVPEFMSKTLLSQVGTVKCDLRFVKEGEMVEVNGLKATAFASLHYDQLEEDGKPVGCDEFGWEIVVDRHRILLPGDVRNYKKFDKLPDFGHVDCLFAHLWLGRGKALSFNNDDLNDFCRFLARFDSTNVILGHLYEISRELEDYWTFNHAGMVMDGLSTLKPEIVTIARRAGQKVNLW